MCCEGWRSIDQIGIPVQLNYNRKPKFQTKIGGIVSCIMIGIVTSVFLSQLISLFGNPQYISTFTENFINQYSPTDSVIYNITSDQFVFATALYYKENGNAIATEEFENFLTVQYFVSSKAKGSDQQSTFYNSTICESQPGYNTTEQSFQEQLQDFPWLCPTQQQFSMSNNPFGTSDGVNLNAVVNYCHVAYPNSTKCKGKEESDFFMQRVRFRHKFVTQYFNPSSYQKNGYMDYRSVYDQQYDLIPDTSTTNNYYIVQNQVNFNQNKFASMDLLSFLQSSLIYYNVQGEGYAQFTDSTNNTEYGLTSLTLLQGSQQFQQQWSMQTFTNIISSFGGLIASFVIVVTILFGSYQEFRFQSSLIGHLYTRDKRISNRRTSVRLKDDKEELEKNILNRIPQTVSYCDWLIMKCRCCFRRCIKPERMQAIIAHENAVGRLEVEMDILDLIKGIRIIKLLSKLSLKNNQRQLVKYFGNYHIDVLNPRLQGPLPPNSIDDLLQGFQPDQDPIDFQILVEILGEERADPNYNGSEASADGGEHSQNEEDENEIDKVLKGFKMKNLIDIFNQGASDADNSNFHSLNY